MTTESQSNATLTAECASTKCGRVKKDPDGRVKLDVTRICTSRSLVDPGGIHPLISRNILPPTPNATTNSRFDHTKTTLSPFSITREVTISTQSPLSPDKENEDVSGFTSNVCWTNGTSVQSPARIDKTARGASSRTNQYSYDRNDRDNFGIIGSTSSVTVKHQNSLLTSYDNNPRHRQGGSNNAIDLRRFLPKGTFRNRITKRSKSRTDNIVFNCHYIDRKIRDDDCIRLRSEIILQTSKDQIDIDNLSHDSFKTKVPREKSQSLFIEIDTDAPEESTTLMKVASDLHSTRLAQPPNTRLPVELDNKREEIASNSAIDSTFHVISSKHGASWLAVENFENSKDSFSSCCATDDLLENRTRSKNNLSGLDLEFVEFGNTMDLISPCSVLGDVLDSLTDSIDTRDIITIENQGDSETIDSSLQFENWSDSMRLSSQTSGSSTDFGCTTGSDPFFDLISDADSAGAVVANTRRKRIDRLASKKESKYSKIIQDNESTITSHTSSRKEEPGGESPLRSPQSKIRWGNTPINLLGKRPDPVSSELRRSQTYSSSDVDPAGKSPINDPRLLDLRNRKDFCVSKSISLEFSDCDESSNKSVIFENQAAPALISGEMEKRPSQQMIEIQNAIAQKNLSPPSTITIRLFPSLDQNQTTKPVGKFNARLNNLSLDDVSPRVDNYSSTIINTSTQSIYLPRSENPVSPKQKTLLCCNQLNLKEMAAVALADDTELEPTFLDYAGENKAGVPITCTQTNEDDHFLESSHPVSIPKKQVQASMQQNNLEAAVRLQSTVRSYLVRCEIFNRLKGFVELHPCITRSKAKLTLVAYNQSAVLIQAVVRGHQDRKTNSRHRNATVIIQKYVRTFLTLIKVFDVLHKIIKLEAQTRGYLTRKRIKVIMYGATKKIQSWWRYRSVVIRNKYILTHFAPTHGWMLTCRIDELRLYYLHHSATRIQKVWQGFQYTKSYRRVVSNVVTCQRIIRGRFARKFVTDFKLQHAVLRIQCHWRRYKARGRVRCSRASFMLWQVSYLHTLNDNKAITIIQSNWRRFIIMRKIAKRGYVVKIQSFVRMYISRAQYLYRLDKRRLTRLHMERSALTIQKKWRSCLARQRAVRNLIHIILIQVSE
jgi:IQ calmodulin-binding motif